MALWLIVAGVTLPWWLPTGRVAQYIARELSRRAGATVRIEGLSLDWGEGLTITGLTIDDEGGSPEPIVRVRRVRCDANPLTLLVDGRPDWLELDRPQLHVTLAEDGTHNLAPLQRLTATLGDRPKPPRISVHQGRISTNMPSRPRPVELTVGDAQVFTGPEGKARITLSAALVQDAGPAPVGVSLQVDPARRTTRVELTFARINIAEAGGMQLAMRYRRGLHGRCAGTLKAVLHDDGAVDNATVTLDLTKLADARGALADRVTARVAFSADGPDGGRLDAKLTAPGLTAGANVAVAEGLADLQELVRSDKLLTIASWPALRSATTGSLAVRVTGPHLLRRLWPELAREWHRAESADTGARLDLTLLPQGETRLDAAVRFGPAGRAVLRGTVNDITALEAEVRAARDEPLPKQVRAAARHLACSAAVLVRDVEAAARLAPVLAPHLKGLPAKDAMVNIGVQHVGGRAAKETQPAHTRVEAVTQVPTHGRARLDVRFDDPTAFWRSLFGVLDDPTHDNALACVENLKVTVRGRIEALSLAKRLGPDVGAALKGVKPNGQAVDVVVTHDPQAPLTVRARLDVPAGVEMALGDQLVLRGEAPLRRVVFVKPRDVPASLALTGTIVDPTALANVSAWLTVGKATATLTGGRAEWTLPPHRAPETPIRVAAGGDVALSNVEALIPCFPGAAGRIDDIVVKGAVRTTFVVDLIGHQLHRAGVFADLRELALDAGEAFVKPSGERTDVTLTLSPAKRFGARYHVDLTADCDYATVNAAADLPDLQPDRTPLSGRVYVTGTVRDAAALVKHSRTTADALGTATLSGACAFRGWGRWRDRSASAGVRLDATDLGFASTGRPQRIKRPGAVAEIIASASTIVGEQDVELRRAAATGRLGDSTFRLDVTGLTIPRALPETPEGWHDLLRRSEIALAASASLDGVLGALAPEMAAAVKQYALAGRLDVSVDTAGDGEELALAVDLDARRLAGQVDLAALADTLGLKGEPAERLASMGRVIKPADRPAGLWLTAAAPRSLTRIRIDELDAHVGPTRATAGGEVGMKHAKGLPPQPTAVLLSGRLAVADAADVVTFVPALTPYRPTGAVKVDFAYRRKDAADRGVLDAAVAFAGFGGQYRGKDVRLGGAIDVAGAALPAKAPPRVGRLRTDGLTVRMMGSSVTVVADVADPGPEATGSVTLRGDTIDAVALEKWLSPTGEVSAWPEGKLTAERTKALRADADKTVALLARLVGGLDVELHARIAGLRARDTVAEDTYDLKQLRLDASVRRGRVRGRYTTELNGGTVAGRFAVALGETMPVLSARKQVRDVVGTENMAAQMHVFFPGNTPKGTFNRFEDLRWPLRDLLAQQTDPRLKPRVVGTARTVTTDGILEATAATGLMADLVPSLRATTYRYRKMTAFSTFGADGRAVNDMVFDGKTYGLYMTGTTDHAGRADYEVGLLALASLQSHAWQHRYRQGRTPLLRFRGLLYRRKITDVTVDYYWPHESLSRILFTNNILYRMWTK